MPAIKAILFDLGDTIIHFETSRAGRFVETGTRPAYTRLGALGFSPPPYTRYLRAVRWTFLRSFVWSRLVGRETRLIAAFTRMHERMGLHLSPAQMNELVFECLGGIRPFFVVDDHARPVAERLAQAGFKLGLVSNTLFPSVAIDHVLEVENLLDWFPIRVYSSDVGFMKPHPRIYETALERLGVPAERTVFIGDRMDKDVRGPARVGMKTMLVARNGQLPRGRVQPDFVIREIAEVPAALGV